MIADLFQGEALRQQPSRTGVSQAMRSRVGNDNAQFSQALTNYGPKATAGERSIGRNEGEEESALRDSRPHRFQITQNGLTHGMA
jgi:hypothetical protein